MNKVKALIAAILGSMVEWYDYTLYGHMAAVLSARFFPDADPTAAMLKHFLAFGAGFLSRPLGAYIFGCIGDGYGRRPALRWTIIGMALPTVAIGLLPSYEQWGISAVVALCICRLLQGMFVSSEEEGVTIFIYETFSKRLTTCINGLYLASTLVGAGFAAFAAQLVLQPGRAEWAWRVPFLIAGVLGLVTLWFRKHLIETRDYKHHIANSAPLRSASFSSFLETFRSNVRQIFALILITSAVIAARYFYYFFWNTYLSQSLNLFEPFQAAKNSSCLLWISAAACIPLGYLADRLGPLLSMRIGLVLTFLIMGLNGLSLHTTNNVPIQVMILTTLILTFLTVPIFTLLAKSFSLTDRFRCAALVHSLSAVLVASNANAIATLLYQKTNISIAPLFYCGVMLILGYIGACLVQPLVAAPAYKATKVVPSTTYHHLKHYNR